MHLYLTAKEAADMLGVDVRTLYTYVSRKKLRTLKLPGERKTRYWREDVERLAKIEARSPHSSPLVPVTRVSLITEEGPFYRGHSALALAETSSLEEVARILWEYPQAFTLSLPKLPDNYDEALRLVAGEEQAERSNVLLPLFERANPRAFDFSREGYARTGSDLVRAFVGINFADGRLSEEPLHEAIGASFDVGDDYRDLIRRLMILSADHELDPTTYAVRALANTGVSPYAIALTGLAAFRGRRLRIGRSEQSIRIIDEIMMSPDPAAPIVDRFRRGEELPGFGKSVYKKGDPRAEAMLAAFDEILPNDEHIRKFQAAVRAALDLADVKPDFILTSALLRYKLGGRREAMSVAVVGRLVGWIAHAMEQFNDYPLIRPRTAYNGYLPGSPEAGG